MVPFHKHEPVGQFEPDNDQGFLSVEKKKKGT